MTGQRVGYRRVSTVDQNTARQLDGVQVDRIFEDKASGKDRNRPQLELCLGFLREGDTLLVHSLDRLGRNVRDLLDIVETLTGKGVTVQFLHPNLSFTGANDSPINKMLFLLLAGFAEMERSLLRERQLEGIAVAKREKRYAGRVPAIREGNGKAAELDRLLGEGCTSVAKLARAVDVSRQTVYAWLAARKAAAAGTAGTEKEAAA